MIELETHLDLCHDLVQLARFMPWAFLERELGALYVENQGSPGKPIRLLADRPELQETFAEALDLVRRIFVCRKEDQNKVYSEIG